MLRYTPAARDDLREIRRFIAQDNPVRAKSFVGEIGEHCKRLAAAPLIHAVQTRIDRRARKAVHGVYLIFYETADDGILVLRVVHSAFDLTELALRPD